MNLYETLMALGLFAMIGAGIAGSGEAFLLIAFGLIITSGLYEWPSARKDEENEK